MCDFKQVSKQTCFKVEAFYLTDALIKASLVKVSESCTTGKMAKTNFSGVNYEKILMYMYLALGNLKKRNVQLLCEFVTINTNLYVLKQVDSCVTEK